MSFAALVNRGRLKLIMASRAGKKVTTHAITSSDYPNFEKILQTCCRSDKRSNVSKPMQLWDASWPSCSVNEFCCTSESRPPETDYGIPCRQESHHTCYHEFWLSKLRKNIANMLQERQAQQCLQTDATLRCIMALLIAQPRRMRATSKMFCWKSASSGSQREKGGHVWKTFRLADTARVSVTACPQQNFCCAHVPCQGLSRTPGVCDGPYQPERSAKAAPGQEQPEANQCPHQRHHETQPLSVANQTALFAHGIHGPGTLWPRSFSHKFETAFTFGNSWSFLSFVSL